MRGERRLPQAFLYLLSIVIILLFSFAVWITNNPQAGEQYCQSHKAGNERCSYHNSGTVAFLWIIDFLNLFSPAITALSGIAVAGFTYALWISTEKMWRSSLRQAEIAKLAFDAADRPWVLFQLHIKSCEQTQYGTLFRFDVIVQNYGRVPATRVNIRTEAIKSVGVYVEGGIFDPNKEKRAIVDFYERSLADGRTSVGNILGSNEKTILTTGANFAKKESWPRSKSDIWLPPVISVSITYRSPEWEVDRIAQTAATFIIGVTDGIGVRGMDELTIPSGSRLTATDGGAFSRVT